MIGSFPSGDKVVSVSLPPNPFPAAADALARDPYKAGQYLIELTAYKTGQNPSGGLATISEIPIAGTPRGSAVDAGQVTLRFADRDYVGAPDDANQANVYYEGRAQLPLLMDRQAPIYPEGDSRVQRQFGAIELINSDGVLDPIVQSYGIDGRQVVVKFGPYFDVYSNFTTIADCVAVQWQGGEDIVRLPLRDRTYSLDQPAQSTLYLGTGGSEGTSEINGKPKPMCYGDVSNITPVLVDPVNLTYQVHDGAISAVSSVYDRGYGITLDTSVGASGDCADYAALIAASIGAGQFATCLAEGFFRLGSSPDGVITADVLGDAGGGYTNSIDQIALRILEDRAGLSSIYIDSASFVGMASISGPMGIYVSQNEAPTSADLISSLVKSVAGWWGARRSGRIGAGRISDPSSRTVNQYLDEYDIIEIVPEEKPIIRWRHRIAYNPNWTVQRGEDLAAGVTDARKQFLTEQSRVVTAEDGNLLTSNLSAEDAPIIQTYLRDSTDAQVIANLMQSLYGVPRSIFRVIVKRIGYRIDLGSIIRVTYPRHGLSTGKNFVCVGIKEDASTDVIELRLWG